MACVTTAADTHALSSFPNPRTHRLQQHVVFLDRLHLWREEVAKRSKEDLFPDRQPHRRSGDTTTTNKTRYRDAKTPLVPCGKRCGSAPAWLRCTAYHTFLSHKRRKQQSPPVAVAAEETEIEVGEVGFSGTQHRKEHNKDANPINNSVFDYYNKPFSDIHFRNDSFPPRLAVCTTTAWAQRRIQEAEGGEGSPSATAGAPPRRGQCSAEARGPSPRVCSAEQRDPLCNKAYDAHRTRQYRAPLAYPPNSNATTDDNDNNKSDAKAQAHATRLKQYEKYFYYNQLRTEQELEEEAQGTSRAACRPPRPHAPRASAHPRRPLRLRASSVPVLPFLYASQHDLRPRRGTGTSGRRPDTREKSEGGHHRKAPARTTTPMAAAAAVGRGNQNHMERIDSIENYFIFHPQQDKIGEGAFSKVTRRRR
ncbi:hypothetical protein STCU_10110 [Strigomonas culicis]|uniref:Uncharacterized protein n=1 Tax=Strigomonas culicis TaxID=28005 RepID=S9V5Q4_9TRYP|nr:hypothetical protein STCU_10110 [Strigomonas culicis]|eukprot:EPY18225.1 hypothetical protein STCU_10110 [Strigomonas culicis]